MLRHSGKITRGVRTNQTEKGWVKAVDLDRCFSEARKLSNQNPKTVKITEKVLEFIVLDDQPLSVVENTGFRPLMEHLEPRYSLPSRTYISETALPELYSRVSSHIADQFKDVQSLSFTTDIWSSKACPMSLLSLTAHWLNDSYDLQSTVLHVKEMRGSPVGWFQI